MGEMMQQIYAERKEQIRNRLILSICAHSNQWWQVLSLTT